INACDGRGNTFLHYLVNKKDIDYEKYIEKLIQSKVDFNRQNRFGRTPFLETLEQKNFKLLAIFLQHIDVANLNVLDSLGNTALHYCKLLNEKYIYDSVFQSNVLALNAQNRDGYTPLHDAVMVDNILFAQYLLVHGADPTITNKDGNNALHLAALQDNVRMCKLLMRTSIDLTAKNKQGKIALHLACANEKSNVAATLINKIDININIVDYKQRTPLHECADNSNGSLAKYLIRHGADENAKDSRGNTLLHLACEKGNHELVRTLLKSTNSDLNLLNSDFHSPLGISILSNHDEVARLLLEEENICIQSSDLKTAMKMSNYEMVQLLIEKDRNSIRVRSSNHGDMIVHTYMRKNFDNLACLETILSFISDNELLTYLSEGSLSYGDNLLHIAAREDTPNALTCFLNLSRVKFSFWANMMLTKNNDNKTPLELANEFKHYAVIKIINTKWKESYENLSHSLRDGHCGVSTTGVTQAKRRCFNCKQTGLVEINSELGASLSSSADISVRPCEKCNICIYKSLDNSMQTFLALLFSDESSSIALDIMDSLVVINEAQKSVHLYLDHIEPWEEFDKIYLNDSSRLINQLVFTASSKKRKVLPTTADKSSKMLSAQRGSFSYGLPPSRPSITSKFRPDGTQFRTITPLEAIYFHERIDLVTHPLIKGLIKWKWDRYAAKHFYIKMSLELLFLTLWTCVSLLEPFPVRYVYHFPKHIWRCILWAASLGFLIWEITHELFEIHYARQRYGDYLLWETERTEHRLNQIGKSQYADPNSRIKTGEPGMRNIAENVELDNTILITNEINSSSPVTRNQRQRHRTYQTESRSPSKTLFQTKLAEPILTDSNILASSTSAGFGSQPIGTEAGNALLGGFSPKKGVIKNGITAATVTVTQPVVSRSMLYFQRLKSRLNTRLKSYYIYYSLNNLFDWICYIFCTLTTITHFIDVSSHTVLRARIHMYIASVTVILIWFRFMVYFRTITISAKTLRSKIVEIKLGELVIMVRMMFDDIIRFLLVFLFLLIPYAFVFYAVFGSKQIRQQDYEQSNYVCERALLECNINENAIPFGQDQSGKVQYFFNGTSDLCSNATDMCRIVQPNGFENFYSLLFSIFRIALVDDIPIDDFNQIDRYFASFVCSTYLLFTAILSINIFIGLISNALQTDAFSTVEARFLIERVEVILNYEWRLSKRKRLQIQEMLHRQCAPLQVNWKDINFDAHSQSREQQQLKAFQNFQQVIDKRNQQFDTFRIQIQQKLTEIDTSLGKLIHGQPATRTTDTVLHQPSSSTKQAVSKRPSIAHSVISSAHSEEQLASPTSAVPLIYEIPSTPHIPQQSNELLLEEIQKLRELVEKSLQEKRLSTGSSILEAPIVGIMRKPTQQSKQSQSQPPLQSSFVIQSSSSDLNERVTDLQLAVNRLHQDVGAIRHVLERMSPLSTSLILGKTASRR
ncbi:unnamed protein product, partial [Didymodactylos carnosus]